MAGNNTSKPGPKAMSDNENMSMVTVRLEGNDVVVRFCTKTRGSAITLASAIVEMIEGGHLTVIFPQQQQTAPSSDTRQ